jgi:nucleoside-diphosphate-sugar epimerase
VGRPVLVTGASGFVGRHLVRALLDEEGASVRVLARSPDRLRAALGEDTSRVTPVEAGLDDPAALAQACAGVETVLHLAALMPSNTARATTLDGWRRVNVEATLALARAAFDVGARRLVFVSSTAAMGAPTAAVVDEDAPCRPTSPYEVTKREAEEGLLALHRDRGLPVVILRPCLVAGAGQRGGSLLSLFKLCRRGLFPVFEGQLEIAKPLLSVHDLVQALRLAATRGRDGGTYFLHSGRRHTLREILEAAGDLVGRPRPWVKIPMTLARAGALVTTPLFRALGREPPLTPERLALFRADRRILIDRARSELGYAPRHTDVGGMLGETYEGFRATGQL